ncbi:MAG TPA: serine hydrolase [Jatrophihabitantaceae bacterium]|nr:serine hydrolase [Jatrophihabitantaceae bacterium]
MRVRVAIAVGFVALCAMNPASAAPVAVPPPAPTPTDSGSSPMVPDPHPPLGGLAPDGSTVGGARLRSRGVVKPAGTKPLPTSLTAQSWILVDLDNGDVLAARDPHGRYQPASILKLLTTVTLLPRLPGKQTVTISRPAALAEGSRAGLVWRGRYTVDELFSALLLVSGNDAADALADAGGGYAQTVKLMNETALKLGAYDTYVQTPSGLDGWQQLTSAYDMALVLRAAVGMPRFLDYDRQKTATLPWQRVNGYGPVTLENQSLQFLTTVRGALVAKSGYTDAAQHTFVAAMQHGNRRLGVVFLRGQRWPTDHWQQAVDLMNWGFGLPAATPPVGHLTAPDAAARAAAPLLPSPVAAHPTVAKSAQSTPTALYGSVVALLLVAAGGTVWRVRARR